VARRWRGMGGGGGGAMMVVEATVLGGDRPGRWWGVMRGGVPAVSVAEGGRREVARVHVRRWLQRQPFSPGGRRPGGARVLVREGGAG
jgi:hypothetical protein